jgi:hypothetical protein
MPSVASFFSQSYAEAREKFLRAAEAAGAHLVDSHPHPLKGPDGGDLATDVAWLGPRDARKLLVLTSSTHGIEGYCGSGCQISWLENRHYYRDARPDTAVLLVHAINPHGFAHGRRVTEDNVDLNRNFVDFSKPLPQNPDYEALQEHVNPAEWTPAAIAKADQAIAAFYKMPNSDFVPKAIHRGQYVNAKGTFYGGSQPTWSRRTFEAIAKEWMQGATDLCLVDYHTGLGPLGFGDLYYGGSAGEGMARQWFDHVTPTEEQVAEAKKDPSMHVPGSVQGTLSRSLVNTLPGVRLTVGGIEYGTIPPREVLGSIRADNWLYAHSDPASTQGKEIKTKVREAFYPSVFEWKIMVTSRSNDVLRQALAGLARA